MDLASYISGVGPTALFTPGSNTPPPFNVQHTGLTDGTGPATASKNMAEIYNRVLLEIKATVVAAGLTIDNTNWTQLQVAIKKIASDAVSASIGTVTTRPKYDSSTNVATTEFVQNALGNVAGVMQVSSSTTLTKAQGGWLIVVNSSGINITLASDFPSGATLHFSNAFALNTRSRLTASSGSFTQGLDTPVNPNIYPLRGMSNLSIVRSGSNWAALNSGAQQIYWGRDSATYITMMSLMSGIVMYWGQDYTSMTEGSSRSVTFPIAYSTECTNVIMSGVNSAASSSIRSFPQLISWNDNGFRYYMQGTGVPGAASSGVHWLAIGISDPAY